jgi:DNA-binding transcriptional MerR regulator
VNRPPADRSHLSIGEVLSLLQGEFPDVTISKIRFLESQGLLDPERTPSGYRKFYDGDIDRLRWILRQQKDHYLPLKVIKDRLDDHEGDSLPPSGPATRPMLPGFADDGNGAGADLAAHNGAGRGGVAVDERPAEPGTDAGPTARRAPAAREAPTRPRAPVTPVATPHAEPQARSPAGPAAPAARPEADHLRPAARQAPAPAPSAPRPGRGGAPTAPAPAVHAAPALDTAATGAVAAAARSGPATAPAGVPGRPLVPAGEVDVTARPAPARAGVSLTIDELAEASGMTVRELRELEGFGLLESHLVGDAAYYDADALQVARTAGGFLRHGIEARHLRSYKVAADREAGLLEQIVLPLLKQRNPEAHRRASQIMAELIGLGEAMRATLLHRELRDHID